MIASLIRAFNVSVGLTPSSYVSPNSSVGMFTDGAIDHLNRFNLTITFNGNIFIAKGSTLDFSLLTTFSGNLMEIVYMEYNETFYIHLSSASGSRIISIPIINDSIDAVNITSKLMGASGAVSLCVYNDLLFYLSYNGILNVTNDGGTTTYSKPSPWTGVNYRRVMIDSLGNLFIGGDSGTLYKMDINSYTFGPISQTYTRLITGTAIGIDNMVLLPENNLWYFANKVTSDFINFTANTSFESSSYITLLKYNDLYIVTLAAEKIFICKDPTGPWSLINLAEIPDFRPCASFSSYSVIQDKLFIYGTNQAYDINYGKIISLNLSEVSDFLGTSLYVG